MFLFAVNMALVVAKKSGKTNKKKKVQDFDKKHALLNEFVKQDEGHKAEPYVGGYNA